jgi:hypothetical protein
MKNRINRKKYFEDHEIYPEPYNNFIKFLKANFKKREDFLSLTKIREKTGLNPETLKKYLAAAVDLRDIRTYKGYFLGCSPYEIIDSKFVFGETFSCPSCNTEVLSPFEGDELVCDCGVHYIKQDTGKWVYQPRIDYLGDASWKLESFSSPGEFYKVQPFADYCSCPDHTYHDTYCKHLKHVTHLVANIVFDKIISDSKFKATGGLIVITSALRSWFDHRKKLKPLTYRALENAIEKSGLNLSKTTLARIVSEFAKKQVLSRTYLPLPCTEGKTLISLNQEVLKHFLRLNKSTIDSYTQSFKVQMPEHKTPFLKLDNVMYSDIMLPNSEFALSVDVNYYFTKATPVRLELRDAQSHVMLRSCTVTLNGEDVTSIPLKLNSLKIQAWVPQVELYFQDDKKQWHLVDHYLAGRRIFAPTIKMSKTTKGLYEVESFSQPGKFYDVDAITKRCTCSAYIYRQSCKHLEMIENIDFSMKP